jgi:2-polyprenyl-3-methyl-5-hydroxy-6-metoxy-1,4-benzoquinol methylase
MNCGICSSSELSPAISKPSKDGKLYTIYKCRSCSILQVSPIPDQSELDEYYTNEYFTKRTDRGYDNYYSDTIRRELFRVWGLNLADLNVSLMQVNKGQVSSYKIPRSLDIGCAAGYFVDYCKSFGWQSQGIEIATEPVRYGRDVLGLDILQEDFLEWDREGKNQYDLISLWASIEHMREPKRVLEKIRQHLNPGGIVVLSTCRWGILSKILKENWRFLNVPEHLFYFGFSEFRRLMESLGYETISSVTYGSGLTTKQGAGIFYRYGKKILDYLVKNFNQGDMMAYSFRRVE